ncbi:MAG: hypothetical protein K8S99_15030 [Planctomycetes bacterium]|nr:hypothetical protein [Planctomycetota bacterium]
MPPRNRPAAQVTRKLFHKTGLAYFWVFNDRCNPDELQPQLDAFAKSGEVAALCLHPRPGLLLPYGSTDWFEFIREMCKRIAKAGLDIWLYDEDPYPSGAAGGRVFQERPEFNARQVERFVFDPTVMDTEFFTFPPGDLLWCGLTSEATGERIDLTPRVGVLRRKWQTWETWDSRFFYPDTPRYTTHRADTGSPEYGLVTPRIPEGFRLMAFVSRPIQYDWIAWGGLVDTFNPNATKRFLELTHEQYKKYVGDMFGKEIKAIFTDEPKYFSKNPWTPGMAEDFKSVYGYDVRPRMFWLDSDSMCDEACITRLQWREYCGKRFEESWLKPVSQWCRRNKLNLVGHISPEDDPIEQANYVSNLFPLFKHFDLAGIDLIIPAVGDHNHPLINVGCVSAASAAQQRNQMGVMSETGACAGEEPPIKLIGKILKWQTIMGVSSPLIHCAYSSVRGPRAFEYPPNYGPNNKPAWPGMTAIHHELADIQPVMRDARQVAPVAILWTIRSFQMQNIEWQTDPTGMRRGLTALLAACLDRQVGTHIIDESILWDVKIGRGEATIGRARYTHLLIPSSTVLHEKTVRKLRELERAGVKMACTGDVPTRVQSSRSIDPLDLNFVPSSTIDAAVAKLPRLIELDGDTLDIRCTAWEKAGKTQRYLMNLRDTPFRSKIKGKPVALKAGQVVVI